MSTEDIVRANYYDRQFLRAADFSDEQAYHVAMRRRHNIAHHRWGIVTGLNLLRDEDGRLSVLPGMAIDGYGREVILAEQRPLPFDAFTRKNSNVLDVWLAYDRQGSDPAQPGYRDCDEGSGPSFTRWRERPQIILQAPNPAEMDRRRPEDVADGDLAFGPYHSPPDSPDAYWPVFLGQILYDPTNPDEPYAVDLANRPYAGLVGEEVIAPSGRARLQIGAERESDDHRFAVFVQTKPKSEAEEPRLAIDRKGDLHLRGSTSLIGNLTIDKGSITFAAGTARNAPAPWQIYHVAGREDGNELRVEMAGRGEGHNRVVIGAWSAGDKAFVPCLTVADDCTVTVHGNLIVEGDLEARLSPQVLSPEAERYTLASYMTGSGRVSVSLGQPRSSATDQATYSALAKGTPAGALQVIVDNLNKDDTELQAFAAIVSNNPEFSKKLVDLLQKILSPARITPEQ